MNEHVRLKQYLIRIFLITMFSVGIAELLINLFFIKFLSPLLNQVFFFEKFIDKKNLSALLITSAEGFFWWITKNLSNIFPNIISEPIRIYANNKVEQNIFMNIIRNTSSRSHPETQLYFCAFIIVIILLICLWLMPFFVAAINFSYLVDKKMRQLENHVLEEQHKYEKQRYLLLSDMAHDLKTPITTISGYAEAMLHDDVPPDSQHSYLQSIYQKSLQMNHIITLMFEYVRLDSIGFSLHQTMENFSECVRGCIAAIYSDFEEKRIHLQIVLPEIDIYARIDKNHMERALNNILVNSYKHNHPDTTVTILLKLQNNKIALRIYDNGVKISEDLLPQIFEPFVQGDASRTSKSGTGLGLSISKKVIEMHQGTLTLFQPDENKKLNYTKVFEIILPNPKYEQNLKS